MNNVAKRDYYEVLGVDRNADDQALKSAYRKLALKYHPDRSTAPDAAVRMRELLEAKACLGDPTKRRAYDASIGIVRRPPGLRPEDV